MNGSVSAPRSRTGVGASGRALRLCSGCEYRGDSDRRGEQSLPDAHVYGDCVGAEVVVLGLHRSGGRRELPIAAAGLADLMREFSLDLIVWPYAERVSDAEALVNWYRSRRACKQNALVVRVGTASQKGYAFTLAIRAW